MNLNLRDVLTGHASRLRYIKRFGTCRVTHPESVAEHSYYVCLYAYLVAEWVWIHVPLPIGQRSWDGLLGDVLSKAVFHDLEECRSGDFPRPFKHSDPKLRVMLEEAAVTAMEQVASPWTPGNPDMIKRHRDLWAAAKDRTFAGRIVAFADYLSCLSYLAQELIDNNHSMLEHTREMVAYTTEFDDKSYHFLRPLVDQAKEIIKEVFKCP